MERQMLFVKFDGKRGSFTFLGDVSNVAAYFIVRFMYRGSDCLPLLVMYAGAGVTLGHNFPFYMNFKGGKRNCGYGRTCLY